MSTRRGGVTRGPPRHQNRTAWKPDRGVQKKETEVGTKTRPYVPISGVCLRCKDQIDWRRKYGKYKHLIEPQKCIQCGKRAVKSAYHTRCTACATEKGVCAKCGRAQGGDVVIIPAGGTDNEEEERRRLQEALQGLRERDKRTLLRVLNSERGEEERNATLQRLQQRKNGDGDDEEEDDDNDDDDENSDLFDGEEEEEEEEREGEGGVKDDGEGRRVMRRRRGEDNEDADDEKENEEDGDFDDDTEDASCRRGEVDVEEGEGEEEPSGRSVENAGGVGSGTDECGSGRGRRQSTGKSVGAMGIARGMSGVRITSSEMEMRRTNRTVGRGRKESANPNEVVQGERSLNEEELMRGGRGGEGGGGGGGSRRCRRDMGTPTEQRGDLSSYGVGADNNEDGEDDDYAQRLADDVGADGDAEASGESATHRPAARRLSGGGRGATPAVGRTQHGE